MDPYASTVGPISPQSDPGHALDGLMPISSQICPSPGRTLPMASLHIETYHYCTNSFQQRDYHESRALVVLVYLVQPGVELGWMASLRQGPLCK